jgi:hypothetical protein
MSERRNSRRRRGGRLATGIIGLLILTITLAGCQIGSAPTPPAAIATLVEPTATASASPTVAALPTPTTSISPAATTQRPTTTTTTVSASPGTPSGATAPTAATPVGAVCAFAPPLAEASGIPPATPGATPAVSATPGRVTAPAQVPPTIPLPDLAARYTLAIDGVDFDAGRLHAAQTVVIANHEGCALDRLYFSVVAARWGWFTLDSVRVGGQPVAAAVTGTVLPVALARPLAPGAAIEVTFDFRLTVGTADDTYTGSGFAGTTRANDILRFAYWFPILSDDHQYPPYLDPPYTATASYDVTMTTPANLVVAPTGEITQETANADGTVTRRITADNVRDFVFALSPNYQVARRRSATGTQIEVYYSPNSFRGSAANPQTIGFLVDKALTAATLAEEQLSDLIGPYPYPSLRVVDGGAALSGGIEFPTLIMVNLNYGSDNLIYHEVGHEWLYGLLGTRTQQDPWIDEGGASFLAAYIEGMLKATPPARAQFRYPLDTSVWAIPASGNQNAATEAIYTQGEAFYTRVFDAMGAVTFWQALQMLYRADRYGIITPRDLLAAWQAASPVDLRPLFKEYLSYPWIDELRR